MGKWELCYIIIIYDYEILPMWSITHHLINWNPVLIMFKKNSVFYDALTSGRLANSGETVPPRVS